MRIKPSISLQRIIINAAQYTDANAGDILLVLLKNGGHCVVCCDDGIGISPKIRKKCSKILPRAIRQKHTIRTDRVWDCIRQNNCRCARMKSISCISANRKRHVFEVRISEYHEERSGRRCMMHRLLVVFLSCLQHIGKLPRHG